MSVLEEAAGIVEEFDRNSILSDIAEAIAASPDGAWIFILSNGPIADSDGVYIDSNVGDMEGVALADVFKFVVLSRIWSPSPDEAIDEDESLT